MATGLALGVGWWLGARQPGPPPAQAAALPLTTPAAMAPVPATEPAPLAAPAVPGADAQAPAPQSDAAIDRLRQSVEMLDRQDRARAELLEQQRKKAAQDRQRADEARRRTDALAASAASAPAPAATQAAGAPPSPPTAAAAPSVEQLCAGSGNVFARDFCRMRECGKPGFAADPVCVRFRQMEESRRQGVDHR